MTHVHPRPPSGTATRLTVYLAAHDHIGRHGLVHELLTRAMQAGMAGATVFAAREGFGESGQVHRTHLLAEDAPRTVVLVDRAERIDAFLAEVADLVADALVTVEPLEVVDL